MTESELSIIDTPVFQRLRRIGQLAFTKYVYPTAEHSRFVHSLGVLQAATNIFEEVLRFNPELQEGNEKDVLKNLQTLRFAALLHDTGHMPLSHAAEKFFLGEGVSHEKVSRYIIRKFSTVAEEIQKNDISPDTVANLLNGKQTRSIAILKKFISDEFDADRADFLLRDSYFCGVKYGEYDYIRYAGSFRLIENENGERAFAIEKGNLHAVESFLLARYHYYLQVPFHRTRRGYDLVFERYLQDLKERDCLPESGIKIEGSRLEIDFDKFQLFDDYTVFEQIKKDMSKGNPWAKILMRQDHVHPVFDVEKESEGNENDFLDLQEELDHVGLKKNQDYFVLDKKVEVHKILEKSDEKGESVYPVVDKARDHKVMGSILDHSSILEATRKKPAHLRRIYVTTSSMPKAQKALDSLKQTVLAREKRKKGGA
ncbi:HD domain-containing protein [Desulfonatronospira sp.]|uniref:HD domain-containing protein n=1 Tax=Desulfonatronospira sp. TaxID=1962951 RepID=UPI0025C18A0E|nr:HD domain-containing protein [Desulfonatronospira sp.]